MFDLSFSGGVLIAAAIEGKKSLNLYTVIEIIFNKEKIYHVLLVLSLISILSKSLI